MNLSMFLREKKECESELFLNMNMNVNEFNIFILSERSEHCVYR